MLLIRIKGGTLGVGSCCAGVELNENRNRVVNTQGREYGGSGVWYPRRRPCGVAINTLVDLNKLAGESPSFRGCQCAYCKVTTTDGVVSAFLENCRNNEAAKMGHIK